MTKKNYEFVDNIRGLAMLFIVFEHSTWLGPLTSASTLIQSIYTFSILISKFGTICFFLIGGFLLGEKFFDYSPMEYFKRRIATVARPWLVWTLIFLACLNLDELAKFLRYHSDNLTAHFGETLTAQLKAVYLFSNYWFILNFMIAISVLLILRRYLYELWLGLIFFLFTLFYSINIYFEWITPHHTVAVFGFVFFLWLGAQLNRKWAEIERFIISIPYIILIIAIICAVLSGFYEIIYLRSINSIDPYNSLRISNIIYSCLMFILLVKARKYCSLKWLDARKTTFGIYLVHYIIVFSFLPLIFRPMKLHIENFSALGLLEYQAIRFIIVYLLTFFLVKTLSKSRYKWLVGR